MSLSHHFRITRKKKICFCNSSSNKRKDEDLEGSHSKRGTAIKDGYAGGGVTTQYRGQRTGSRELGAAAGGVTQRDVGLVPIRR